jgi:hypothetical protein
MTDNPVADDPKPRYHVTDADWRTIDQRMIALKARLGANLGSLLDPQFVADALQALMENRVTIQPRQPKPISDDGVLDWDGPETIPMTPEQWRRLEAVNPARMKLFGWYKLTDLLLRAPADLQAHTGTGPKTVERYEAILGKSGLRLPTQKELNATEGTFWVWIQPPFGGCYRLARFLIPELLIGYEDRSRPGVRYLGYSQLNLESCGITTVGELLALTRSQLMKLLRKKHQDFWRKQTKQNPGQPRIRTTQSDIDKKMQEIDDFLRDSGLTAAGFTFQPEESPSS